MRWGSSARRPTGWPARSRVRPAPTVSPRRQWSWTRWWPGPESWRSRRARAGSTTCAARWTRCGNSWRRPEIGSRSRADRPGHRTAPGCRCPMLRSELVPGGPAGGRACRTSGSGLRENHADGPLGRLSLLRRAPAALLRRPLLPDAWAQLQAASHGDREAEPARRDDHRLRGDPEEELGARAQPVRPPHPERLPRQSHRGERDRLDLGPAEAPASSAEGAPPVGNARVLRHVQRGLSRRAGQVPDVEAMRRAVQAFLEASGLSPDDPELKETPARVAEAWAQHFLDGYGRDPDAVLAERIPVPEGSRGELVVVTGLRFHSMCPHHLLPVEGRAHIAYVPGEWVVGFGRLAALLDTW